jgi:hypothetical protein
MTKQVEMHTSFKRILLQGVLVSLSLIFLSIGTFAGLLHGWHRFFFISLAGLDDSFYGTLAFLLGGIACWILAGLI